MSDRPSAHYIFMEVAFAFSKRSTCMRRQVGCVLVNKYNHVLATGYNGVAMGEPHCIDDPCPGARFESGSGLDLCEAIHAEQNALLQCHDHMDIEMAYCTTFPCIHCIKLLMNTTCNTIYYRETYSHDRAMELWQEHGGIAKMI